MDKKFKSLTIEQHVAAVRKNKKVGTDNLVAALRVDMSLAEEVHGRLRLYREMEKAGRMPACWISRLTKETLTAALAVVNTQPGVPAGG